LLRHRGHRGLHPEEDAELVDLEGAPEGLGAGLGHRRELDDAGVVDQGVEAAELRHGDLDRLAPGLLGGDIKGDEDRIVAEIGCDLVALLGENVRESDPGALLDEVTRLRLPLPPGGAGDQRHLALEAAQETGGSRSLACSLWKTWFATSLRPKISGPAAALVTARCVLRAIGKSSSRRMSMLIFQLRSQSSCQLWASSSVSST